MMIVKKTEREEFFIHCVLFMRGGLSCATKHLDEICDSK